MNILKVNSVKTKYMVMARGQNAGQNNKKYVINSLKPWKFSNIWEQA
jgi:hypothetical protein